MPRGQKQQSMEKKARPRWSWGIIRGKSLSLSDSLNSSLDESCGAQVTRDQCHGNNIYTQGIFGKMESEIVSFICSLVCFFKQETRNNHKFLDHFSS